MNGKRFIIRTFLSRRAAEDWLNTLGEEFEFRGATETEKEFTVIVENTLPSVVRLEAMAEEVGAAA